MSGAAPLLTLYRRVDCHLCEEAVALLNRLQLCWQAVDVDEDEELVRRFGDRVPVVSREGREIAQAPITEAALRAAVSGSAGD